MPVRWGAARPRLFAATLLTIAAVLWLSAAAIAVFTWDVIANLPRRADLARVGDMAQATTLFDIHDRPVFTIFKEQRVEIPLAKVSPLLIKAVLAIEDQRFYDHRGVDVIRVAGAAAANLRSGRRSQGGSTITQQLARQSFLSRDKTVRRKVKEVLLAAQLEQTYSKDEILELYLNKVYFGDGFYGVEAASLGYFGEACLRSDAARSGDAGRSHPVALARMPRAPTSIAPGRVATS